VVARNSDGRRDWMEVASLGYRFMHNLVLDWCRDLEWRIPPVRKRKGWGKKKGEERGSRFDILAGIYEGQFIICNRTLLLL
jgi:hypothetical protein